MTMLKWSVGIFVLTFIVGCIKETDCFPDESCDTVPYPTGDVKIRVTPNLSSDGVLLVFYNGFVDDRDTLWSGYVVDSEVVFEVDVDKRYAAEVYYPQGGSWLVALDGKKLKEEFTRDCGEKCYSYPSVTLDCRKK